MKIGILTYHRTLNYGGCLQALAMRLILEGFGHKVYYVDYWPNYHKKSYAIFNIDFFKKSNWKGKLMYLINTARHATFIKRRHINFDSFHNKYTYPYCKPLSESYDVIVYGSDQIWRKQDGLNDYNPIYFGKNDFITKKNVSFSASMGLLPDSDTDKNIIKALLSNMNKIAVREKELKELLNHLGFDEVSQTLDPTLLVSTNVWDKILSIETYSGQKYILVYALWGDVFDINSIKSLAEKEHLLIKFLRGNATHADTEIEVTTAGPETFIRLIKNATYVFSSSFHGVAFSLIFGKQFFASFKTNGGRARSLLDAIGIPERYLENYQPIATNIGTIDYNKVNEKLNTLKFDSLNYLKSALNG